MEESPLDIVAFTWGNRNASYHCVRCTAERYATENSPKHVQDGTWFLPAEDRPVAVHRHTAELTVEPGRARTCRRCSTTLAERPR